MTIVFNLAILTSIWDPFSRIQRKEDHTCGIDSSSRDIDFQGFFRLKVITAKSKSKTGEWGQQQVYWNSFSRPTKSELAFIAKPNTIDYSWEQRELHTPDRKAVTPTSRCNDSKVLCYSNSLVGVWSDIHRMHYN